MFDVRESDPLELSEKATLPVMYGIISQETCRIFMVKHNFGEKSAADLSAMICAVGALFARLRKIFRWLICCTLPAFRQGEIFCVRRILCLATTKKNGQ